MDKIKANMTKNRKGAGRPKIIVDIEILKNNSNIDQTSKAKNIYEEILNEEKTKDITEQKNINIGNAFNISKFCSSKGIDPGKNYIP